MARFEAVFCQVVESGSYSAAAAVLGVTPGAVSRAVARREEALGVLLLHRTTRSMTTTAAGQTYYEACRRALSLLDEAERALRFQADEPRGLVRLSVPTTYGHHRVLPMLPEFQRDCPEVQVDVDVSSRNVDVAAEPFDLAIRMGPLPDSSLVARRLEDAPIGVFASPRYLAEHGAPSDPSELGAHRCVAFVRPSTGRPIPWLFLDPEGGPFEVAPTASLCCRGDPLGALSLARAGAGLVQAFRFTIRDALDSGELVEVLLPWAGRSAPFTLLHAGRRSQSPAARRLADFLIERSVGPG